MRGAGRIGCVLILLLSIAAGYAGYKAIPIYYRASEFEDDVRLTASRAGAHYWGEEQVIQELLGLAQGNGIPITRQQIDVRRTGGQISISVYYSIPVEILPGYTLQLDFRPSAKSLVGTL